MSPYERIRTALSDTFSVVDEGESARVTTQCLYPSNSFVQVLIRGGTDTFFVSDEGGALREIESAGAEIKNPDRLLLHLVAAQGLSIKNGIIRSPQCNSNEVVAAIAFVANASMQVAEWLYQHSKIAKQRNFRVLVSQFLREIYKDLVRVETLTGKSNKSHKFENIILLSDGKRLSIDPVIHDPASINARLVANMDVRAADYKNLEQRIVYDDEDDWNPAELNLLQIGATLVPFSKAAEVLRKFPANAN